MWICPVCQASLLLSGQQWQCVNKHSYDRAKAGYVNLLLANHKSTADPGDRKEVMSARRAFLEEGHFLPLVNCLADLITQRIQTDTLALYDLGCGEGYYLANTVSLLNKPGLSIHAAGNDISRSAVDKASRKYPQLQFAIASNFKTPVPDNSQDVVLQIFAPASEKEVHRILSVSGLWLQVSPAEEHLSQLRAALYQTPRLHTVDERTPEGFEEVHQTRVTFELSMPKTQSRKDLLMMTPYYWSVEEGTLDAVIDKMVLLTADFSIRIMQKRSTA